ncbi:MAG: hypothetical protein HQL69_23180 [Magnetococcales bacterium]|nr:hypothetical protein [Magnetococcales bacterium]
MISHDCVTVLTTKDRANKLVTRSADGEVHKSAGPPIVSARAETHRVPNAKAMEALLREVGDNPCLVIILGFFPGTEPSNGDSVGQTFNVVSKGWLLEHSETAKQNILGWHEVEGGQYIARLKKNMLPSSWAYFDRDTTPDMPDHLVKLDSLGWLSAMGEMIPALNQTSIIEVPSTTGRVLVDGEPIASSGSHYYLQISDPYDLERFGAVLLQHSFLHGYGFMKKWGDATRQWSIFDPTTFSHERLVYEGKPSVEGTGLSVGPPVVTIINGDR